MKPLILENERVKLELLSTLNYKLLEPIAKEKDLIYYSPSDISTPKKLENYVLKAIKQFEEKTAIPFIIYDKQLNSYAGSTRFGHINWVNKTLHIGWTWIGYKFQGTGLNNNIKTLMLNYAFDTLNF